MYDLIIRDATIITSAGRQVADIAVEDGKIAYVGRGAEGQAREEVPGIGRFVIPGVIDTQVRMRQPGSAHGSEWSINTRSAVVGGVTTVFDLPDETDPTTSRAALADKAALAARDSICNFGLWVAASTDDSVDPWQLVDEGLAMAPLVWLDRATGPLAVGIDGLRRVLESAAGRLVGVHAEDAAAFTGADGNQRPPEAAAAAVRQLLDLVQEIGGPAHITSLSTAAELNLLDPFRGDLPITTSVSPPHLFLSSQNASKVLGDAIAVEPPLRPELDRRGLWTAIKRGRIDVACSGHTPLSRVANSAGAAGMPGVGLLFPMLMSAVRHGRMPLERVVEMCCEAPTRIFGLAGKGRIEAGADADLVLMTEGETVRMQGPPAWATVDWTPFTGRDAGVAPKLVLVGGRVVAREGVLMDDVQPGVPVSLA